ncbi:MAG TPA: hypothetical protein VK206_01985, partial [Anaerolineales bacterium]|nr:hypothetical protein [Anaerolineales bacterium]
MNRVLQFPLLRMIVAILLVGVGIALGQMILGLLRSAFSITNAGLANLLAFLLVTPLTYFAYWIYVHYVEKRELTELGRTNAAREFGLGSLTGFGLFSVVITILWLLGVYRVSGASFVLPALIGALLGAFVSA